jgi:hypothetical protein
MYTTIIRERDSTLGGCGATGEIPSFFTHTSSEPLHRNCYLSLYMYREEFGVTQGKNFCVNVGTFSATGYSLQKRTSYIDVRNFSI